MRRRRGAVAVFVLVMLPVLLGLGALVIDVGVLNNTRADLQNAADAASLAAASAFTTDEVMQVRMADAQSDSMMGSAVARMSYYRAGTVAAVNPTWVTSHTELAAGDVTIGWIDLDSATSNTQPGTTRTKFLERCLSPWMSGRLHRSSRVTQVSSNTAPIPTEFRPGRTALAKSMYIRSGPRRATSEPSTSVRATKACPRCVPSWQPEDYEAEVGTDILTFADADGAPTTYSMTGTPGLRSALESSIEPLVGQVVSFFLHSNVTGRGANASYTITEMRSGRVMGVRLSGLRCETRCVGTADHLFRCRRHILQEPAGFRRSRGPRGLGAMTPEGASVIFMAARRFSIFHAVDAGQDGGRRAAERV